MMNKGILSELIVNAHTHVHAHVHIDTHHTYMSMIIAHDAYSPPALVSAAFWRLENKQTRSNCFLFTQL